MPRLLFQYDDGGRAAAGYRGRGYLRGIGSRWIPTMHIGSGCKVHLREGELPAGRLIVALSKHLCAVIDGVIHDPHDCSRGGRQCVYGYWTPSIDRHGNLAQST